MLTSYEKFRLFDENRVNSFLAEVNWDMRDEKTNRSQIIKFTFPDGKEAFVKKGLLNSLLFVIGTEEEQRRLIPQKIVEVRNYRTMLGITAKKNIAKGEKINVEVNIPLPSQEQEIIGALKHA